MLGRGLWQVNLVKCRRERDAWGQPPSAVRSSEARQNPSRIKNSAARLTLPIIKTSGASLRRTAGGGCPHVVREEARAGRSRPHFTGRGAYGFEPTARARPDAGVPHDFHT